MPRSRVVAQSASLRERAYAHIQRKIASGELRPESSLSEVLLAKELKMSRTPVREALNQLVTEGLVEQTQNRGTFVAQFRRHDIIELYELREALEVYSVQKAAKAQLRKLDLQRWQDLCDELLHLKKELEQSGEQVLNKAQMRRFIASDFSFHNLLMQLATNQRMLKVVNETRLLIRIFGIQRPKYDAAALMRIYEQHNAILQAVAAHDAERAVQLLSTHIRVSLEERLEAYHVWERESSLERSAPALADFAHD